MRYGIENRAKPAVAQKPRGKEVILMRRFAALTIVSLLAIFAIACGTTQTQPEALEPAPQGPILEPATLEPEPPELQAEPIVGPSYIWEYEFSGDRLWEQGDLAATVRFKRIAVINLLTGQELWYRDDWDVDSQVFGVDDRHVYLIREDDRIYALDLATGNDVWKLKAEAGENFFQPVLDGATPVIYLPFHETFPNYSSLTQVAAIDATNGNIRGVFASFEGGCYQPKVVAAWNGYAAITCWDNLHGVIDSNAQFVWRPRWPAMSSSSDTIVLYFREGVLFVSDWNYVFQEGAGFQALDLATGRVLADYQFGPATQVRVFGQVLFAWQRLGISNSGGRTGIAIDTRTLEKLQGWRSTSSFVVVGASSGRGYLYEADESLLTAINLSPDQPLVIWENDEIHVKGVPRWFIANDEKAVFMSDDEDRIYFLDAGDGSLLSKDEYEGRYLLFPEFVGSYVLTSGYGDETYFLNTGESPGAGWILGGREGGWMLAGEASQVLLRGDLVILVSSRGAIAITLP